MFRAGIAHRPFGVVRGMPREPRRPAQRDVADPRGRCAGESRALGDPNDRIRQSAVSGPVPGVAPVHMSLPTASRRLSQQTAVSVMEALARADATC
jgi:hypothetical protein